MENSFKIVSFPFSTRTYFGGPRKIAWHFKNTCSSLRGPRFSSHHPHQVDHNLFNSIFRVPYALF